MDKKNCIICFNELTDTNISVLSCKHKYHMDCIFLHIITEKRKNKIAKCPLCRQEINLQQNFKHREPHQIRNQCFPFINMMLENMMSEQQLSSNNNQNENPLFMGFGFSFPMDPN